MGCASFAGNDVVFISVLQVDWEVLQLPGHDKSQFEIRPHADFSSGDYLQLQRVQKVCG